MRRICRAVMAWGDCFAEANRIKRSGMSEDDVIQMAHKLHKGKFNYEHAWRLLRHYRKWEDHIAPYAEINPGKRAQQEDPTTPTNVGTPERGSSGKRTRLNDGGFSPAWSVEEGSASNTRPIGRDAAKKGKGALKTVIEEVSHFSNAVKNLNFNMTGDKDNEVRRLAIDEEKVRVKEKKVNWSILSKLMDCPSLTPEMEEMKAKLIRELL
ncbi:glutathione S-transferase T2-like [Silene latifolia]|uniref:glutathione S-transferase T2-like n=1 Tax=Silene latifolia TaxID=37657 RepID=UPI003D76A4C2